MASYYYNNATNDQGWTNILNWWYDSNYTIPAADLPGSLNSDDYAYIDATVSGGIPSTFNFYTIVDSGGSLQIPSINLTINDGYYLQINNGGTVYNNANIVLGTGGGDPTFIGVDGALYVYGSITGNGMGSYIVVYGDGYTGITQGAYISLVGLTNSTGFENNGSVDLFGTITTDVFNNYGGIVIYNAGILNIDYNYSNITSINGNYITINSGGTLNVYGFFNNYGPLYIGGYLNTSSSNFSNYSSLEVYAGGTLYNSGYVYNNNTITTDVGFGTFTNDASFINYSTFYNNGLFVNNGYYENDAGWSGWSCSNATNNGTYVNNGYSDCGTYNSQFCSGFDLYYVYNDGFNGTYNTLHEHNSITCGYIPPQPDYYFYNNGSGDTNWGNPANWWLDSAYSSPAGAVPTETGSTYTMHIESLVDTGIPVFDFNVINNSVITNNGAIANYYQFYNNGVFNNNGTFTNDGDIIIDSNPYNYNTYYNYGTFTNTANLSVINGSIAINYGSFGNVAAGILSICTGSSLNNNGSLYNYNVIDILGGGLYNGNGASGVLYNMSSSPPSIINVLNGGYLYNYSYGYVSNYTSIINYSYFANYNGTFLNSTGEIDNYNSLYNNGTFYNQSAGTINNYNSIQNDNVLMNSATLTNASNGTFNNTTNAYLGFAPTGTFTNQGTYLYGSKNFSKPKGTVQPIVQSPILGAGLL